VFIPPEPSGATFDPTGAYRYALWRVWDGNRPPLVFVMLNPSIADAERDDPTIRRCLGFACAWGYGALTVVNLFALRATCPHTLRRAADPVGPDNDEHLRAALAGARALFSRGVITAVCTGATGPSAPCCRSTPSEKRTLFVWE
jgi:hypothetical protein